MSLRVNDVDDLPKHLQEQVKKKLGSCSKAKDSKYRNIRTEQDGHVFDSAHEAQRYSELQLLCAAKEITMLMIQVPFPLPGDITYRADFVYYDLRKKCFVVEDVKGFKTKEYKIKKKLMREIGIDVEEV